MNLLDLMGSDREPRRMPMEPIARHAECERRDDHLFRWTLERRWGPGPAVGLLLQNPSDADASKDDPTTKRTIMFADSWGFRAIVMVNLYPIVTPHPSTCAAWRKSADAWWAVAENWRRAGIALAGCEVLIAAYGALDEGQGVDLLKFLAETKAAGRKWRCLGTTKDGWPKHPLARGKHRVPDGTEAAPYKPLGAFRSADVRAVMDGVAA